MNRTQTPFSGEQYFSQSGPEPLAAAQRQADRRQATTASNVVELRFPFMPVCPPSLASGHQQTPGLEPGSAFDAAL